MWYAAHTRPRCEKKLAGYCNRFGVIATLPCYKVLHQYRGKKVAFQKVLFPNYVFLDLEHIQRRLVLQSEYIVNLLDISDQILFSRQLGDILRSLEASPEVRLAPQITEGMQARIKTGPLQGLEGLVENRIGMTHILLRLDFIGKAVAVKITADELEEIVL